MAAELGDVARTMQLLTSSLIEAATRLAILLIERRAQRLRQAVRDNEHRSRHERAQAAAHRAADAAIWRRTTDPGFWRHATPERIARVWQAVSTWHQVDPEAAGVRAAVADRLRRRGINVITDAANPGDANWLRAALALADAEREHTAVMVADLDGDRHAGQPLAATADHDRIVASAASEDRRYQTLVTQNMPQDRAARVLADASWPILARTMARMDRDGRDVAALLRELPYDTTNSKLPAVLTDWTLRQVAAGPVRAHRAETVRHRHLDRLATAANLSRLGTNVEPGTEARINSAFPISTRRALNQTATGHRSPVRPATMAAQVSRQRGATLGDI